eukprot:GSChrysophyteH1.ASY1.ANO1.2603.1 assembled CDS
MMIFLRRGLSLLLVALVLVAVRSFCPNGCSGHGKCTRDNACACDDGYDVVADCSQMRCPYDIAWADKAWGGASNPNKAHLHKGQECSRNGMCNRENGKCECFPGFEGQACQRETCRCSENGICLTLHDANNQTYTGWEAQRLQTCVCDIGFTGPHCELRMCPKGDDPLTLMSDYYQLKIKLMAWDGTLGGNVHLLFNGETLIFPAKHQDWTLAQCKESFESLPNIAEVRCSRGNALDEYGSIEHTISIHRFPMYPHENNIYSNDGTGILDKFICRTKYMTGSDKIKCQLSELSVAAPPEYAYCSNRGICDFSTGVCNCYEDFTNPNCDTYRYGVRAMEAEVQSDILVLQNTRNTFSGSVLKLQSDFPSSKRFNMLKISDSYRDIMDIDGNGNLNMHYGGLNIRGKDGHGGVTIHNGGMWVTGGATIMNNGMTVTGGLTINSGGLHTKKQITVSDGVTISSGGLKVTGGITLKDLGLVVERG